MTKTEEIEKLKDYLQNGAVMKKMVTTEFQGKVVSIDIERRFHEIQ